MDRTLIVIILFMLAFLSLNAQQHDKHWIFGYDDILIQQNTGKVLVSMEENGLNFQHINTSLNFANTSAAISDREGNLLFYTNGCVIAGSDHRIMPNGEGLNPGIIHDMVCPEYGYIVDKGALIIPFPGCDVRYAVLHLGAIYGIERALETDRLYLTVVEMDSGTSAGEVTTKNHILFEGDIESLAVVKHGNGRDWWIMITQYSSNIYHSGLFTEEGLAEWNTMASGYDFPAEFCKYTANSLFSPDGSYFVRANPNCGFVAFDFDRCTGMISNPYYQPIPKTQGISGNDVVITASNNLYIISPFSIPGGEFFFRDRILKFDLEKLGISASFGEYIFPDNFATFDIKPQFFIQYNNGSLYTYTLKNKGSLYKINNPELKTHSIDFVHYIDLPVANALSSVVFPNYNLGPQINSVCDTLTSVMKVEEPAITIYPNPASDVLNILIEANDVITELRMFSGPGELLNSVIAVPGAELISFDISHYKSGIYFLKVINRKSSRTYKFIKL